MDFEYPSLLFLLLFVPLLFILFRVALQRNRAMREEFGNWALLKTLLPDYDPKKNPLKFGLLLGAYVLLVIAVANPRMGSITKKAKRSGVDVYIALDISKSMWAKDVTPKSFDRLEKARLFSLKLMEELKGNRLGLIFFAGEAFVQMPLTLDYSAAILFLNDGLGDFEITQGTVFDEVIKLASKSGHITAADDDVKIKKKALVIISDGEDHDKQGTAAAKEARKMGLTTFCVAVGSAEGATVPQTRNVDASAHSDKNGQAVRSMADKNWLKKIAGAGAGKFFDIENANAAIRNLSKEISKLEKEEFDVQNFNEYESYYQFFVFIALGLLIAEFLISYRKSEKKVGEQKDKTAIIAEEKM